MLLFRPNLPNFRGGKPGDALNCNGVRGKKRRKRGPFRLFYVSTYDGSQRRGIVVGVLLHDGRLGGHGRVRNLSCGVARSEWLGIWKVEGEIGIVRCSTPCHPD